MKSYQRRNKVWQSASPTPTEKLVLLAIESFADEESKCHPGKARLAHMTGYDIKTVQRAIASLEEKGLIEVHERYDEDGRQTSNGYRLIITQLSLNLSDAPAPEKRLVRQPTKSPTPGHSAPHPQGTAPPKQIQ